MDNKVIVFINKSNIPQRISINGVMFEGVALADAVFVPGEPVTLKLNLYIADIKFEYIENAP
jgi:hypothetical protein